jgi:4-amino-4-deoxy-L-arabinose transferase-like glycosyltransferase
VTSSYKILTIVFFTAGALLRILLCWFNPPSNAFDDHFEPILLIMQTGFIPAKDACWQCYHPPVFYWVSAMAGNLSMWLGIKFPDTLKLLQFLSCAYGVLTLGVILLILRKLPLTDFSRLIAFGAVCFLPRHIYMSAMNSNDSISYLFVAVSVYLLLILMERRFPVWLIGITSVVVSAALFTKYTAFILLPAIIIPVALLIYKSAVLPRKRVVVSLAGLLILPVTLLTIYLTDNIKNYGSALPWNVRQQRDPSLTQVRDDVPVDFVTFKPWESTQSLILAPGKLHSFWTLMYNGMWFDNEPKFLYFLDSNHAWWSRYYLWLTGKKSFPGDNPSFSGGTKFMGTGLLIFGLLPLLLIVIGIYHFFIKFWKAWNEAGAMDSAMLSIFPILLLGNAAATIALVLNLPVFSAMKASYFLNSLPSFAVLLGFGVMTAEKNNALRRTIGIAFAILYALVSLHILHIFFFGQTN